MGKTAFLYNVYEKQFNERPSNQTPFPGSIASFYIRMQSDVRHFSRQLPCKKRDFASIILSKPGLAYHRTGLEFKAGTDIKQCIALL